MKTRAVILTAVVMTGFWFAAPSHAQTTTVRGQVVRYGSGFPVAGTQVTLYSPSFGSRSVPSITGNNGIYYLYNIPAGTYALEVWVSNPPLVYPVQIFGFPFHDLPQAVVP